MLPWSTKLAITSDGSLIVREFHVSGEQAYRQHTDGHWSHSIDHKGLWIAVTDVPDRVLSAAESYRRSSSPPSKDEALIP
jgi:hypothetical protein